jgi:hypothetical protein
VSRTAAEPNKLKIWFNQKYNLGSKSAKFVSIRDSHDAPLWFVHPAHGSKVDIVALPLEDLPDVEMYAINTLPEEDLAVHPLLVIIESRDSIEYGGGALN